MFANDAAGTAGERESCVRWHGISRIDRYSANGGSSLLRHGRIITRMEQSGTRAPRLPQLVQPMHANSNVHGSAKLKSSSNCSEDRADSPRKIRAVLSSSRGAAIFFHTSQHPVPFLCPMHSPVLRAGDKREREQECARGAICVLKASYTYTCSFVKTCYTGHARACANRVCQPASGAAC